MNEVEAREILDMARATVGVPDPETGELPLAWDTSGDVQILEQMIAASDDASKVNEILKRALQQTAIFATRH